VGAHVRLLVRLVQGWAVVNLIIGLSLTAFAVAAALLVTAAGTEPGTEVAAGVTAATLTVLALAALAWAAAHWQAARGLTRGRPWARNLALVLAAFNLLLLPLGTALGLYTLWVLLHEHVREQFV
jgi:uncharacterized membrane protein YidH (DUF202 family)